jgi:acyl carrier protein
MPEPTRVDLQTDEAALAFVLRCFAATEDLYLRSGVTVGLETRLRDDLGIDSIGRVSLFYTLLDTLGVDEGDVDGGDESVATLSSVGDVIAFARRVSGARPAR